MSNMTDKIQEGIRKQSYAVLLGLQVEEAQEGRVVISCQKRPDLLQQTGIFHGGVTGGMCEAAASYAALTVLPEGQSVVGVEYKISLLRPITADKVIGVAKVLKRGKQLVVVDVEAFNEGSDQVAAKMIFTGMIIEE